MTAGAINNVREPINFVAVTTPEQFGEVKRFAATDGHRLDDQGPPFPIITMWRGNRMFGYLHVMEQPVVMPAFNKKLCSKRDFYESCKKIIEWMKDRTKSDVFPTGTGFIALPPKLAVDEKIVRKLGFEPMLRDLWQHVDWRAE